jgi:hypothetical protein
VYTGHRGLESVVIPGASHIGLMACAAKATMVYRHSTWRRAEAIILMDVMFPRPYLVAASRDQEHVFASGDAIETAMRDRGAANDSNTTARMKAI